MTRDIKVFSSPPLRSLLRAVGPEFELRWGLKLNIDIASVLNLKQRLDAGDPFDVAVLTPELIDALVVEGRIASGATVPIARSGLGVAVRADRRLPDISSAIAFRNELLSAKSVMYAADSAATSHIEHMFKYLGITEYMRPKIVMSRPGGHIGSAVANGEAELGLTHIPVILESRGAALAGPLPSDLQFYVYLTAGMSVCSANPDGARSLIHFLATSATSSSLEANGLEGFSALATD